MDQFELGEKGKIKRIFVVRNKIIPQGSIVHIIQRAPGKELLFLEKNDYLYFLHLLKETSAKYNFKVLCFTLMPNHFHILVRFEKQNASEAIKNLCERYAKYFNIKYQRKGHVFYGAFRASLCLDETYLLSSSIYIHLNPFKANLCKNLFSYKWSSISLYAEQISRESFVGYKFILNILNEDIEKARKIYKKLLKDSANLTMENILENRRALKIFRNNLVSFLYKIFNKTKRKYLIPEIDIENKIKELKSKKRLKKPQEKSARKYLIEQLLSRGYSIPEISKYLGLSRQTIYKTLKFTK